VRYSGFLPVADGKPLGITLGHFKIPFSFEQLMADKDLSLMERSLPTALLKSRAPGAMLSWSGDHWSTAAMLFGEQLASNTTNQQDEGGGASLRTTWAPWIEDGATLHFGVATQYVEPTQKPGGATLRYASRPESRMTSILLVDTGVMAGVEDATLYGLETAATLGSLTFNSEYIRALVARASSDARFTGWYAQAAWMLSGELRGYNVDNGIFKAIQPLHPVGTGGSGAWELTARYSQLDLNDGAIIGGKETNATLGLGWYANPFVRISGNWVRVLDLDRGLYDSKDVDALQMRLQFAY
jgi:phosphate-selective porin OprO/OprP